MNLDHFVVAFEAILEEDFEVIAIQREKSTLDFHRNPIVQLENHISWWIVNNLIPLLISQMDNWKLRETNVLWFPIV